MKLKDLIKNREKLKKYDELEKWKDFLEVDYFYLSISGIAGTEGNRCNIKRYVPDNIKQIFISAIDKEIDKLDDE